MTFTRPLLRPAPHPTAEPVADAVAVLSWAHEEFGDELCVTASFGDATLPHLANTAVPGIEITVLDTGYLFAETDWFIDHLTHRHGLTVRVVRPPADLPRDVWQTDPDACCRARKVEPLERALTGRAAWVTGLRRTDSAARRSTPVVHADLLRGVTKINPLAAWTDDDVARYAADHDLSAHPLADRGYRSIGCWPCTRAVPAGADPRSGRWSDSDKTECGLHLATTVPGGAAR